MQENNVMVGKVACAKHFYPIIRFRSEYDTIGTFVKTAVVYLGTALVNFSNQSRIVKQLWHTCRINSLFFPLSVCGRRNRRKGQMQSWAMSCPPPSVGRITNQSRLIGTLTHQVKLSEFSNAKFLVLVSPTHEEIQCMNPNYNEFRNPQIKAQLIHGTRHPHAQVNSTPRRLQCTSPFSTPGAHVRLSVIFVSTLRASAVV